MPENNKLIAEIKPSGIYAAIKVSKFICVAILFALIGAFFNFFFLFGVVFALFGYLKFLLIIYTKYSIYEETISIQKGIFSVRTDNLELYRVKDYIIEQPFLLRLFKLMIVKLYTTDLNNEIIILEGLKSSDITQTIRELVQVARIRNRIFEIN
ncbi:MAG: PH domain-containing protein [Prolixibacteraceae bacterium]|nr:PH domain-containing protein [Prolixibacteraceae bacterium]